MQTETIEKITEEIVGFTIIIPPKRPGAEIAIRNRLPVHARMKFVPEETVAQTINNEPMLRISRVNDIPNDIGSKENLLRQFLMMLFPEMIHFGSDYAIRQHNDKGFDSQVKEITDIYRKSGMMQEIELVNKEVRRFKEMRSGLDIMLNDDLVSRGSIIPIEYLPDIFMAVPVWYFYANGSALEKINSRWIARPRTTEWVADFCHLFPSQRWMDTFQLFNYRARGIDRYKGEIIPPDITKRMIKASEFFDYVVIATPYHDEAGADWNRIQWERAIDPYLIGFKKGVPFFFVLGRFSKTGTFPLLNELISDTIEFLRENKKSLSGFDGEPKQWNMVGRNLLGVTDTNTSDKHGAYLINHVNALLQAFEQGILFDWLRGNANLAEV